MTLVDSDLQLVKSFHSVNGIDSLGGEMTSTVVSDSIGSLWDNITDSELSGTIVGEYEVRCIFARNNSPNNETMQSLQVWVEQNTAAPYTDIDIGVGVAQIGDAEQTVSNENTLPANIFWTFARGEENAQLLGDLPGGLGKSLWIRRHAGPTRSGASYPSDNYILRFKMIKTGAIGGGGGGPPPVTSHLDPFGVRMIYKTQETGDVSAPFYMNMNDPYSDCRFNTNTGTTATKNADGSFALGPSPRIRLFTSQSGCARSVVYDAPADTYDQDIYGERGYMYRPNDWKNVEITGYFKVVGVNAANTSERKLYLYSRTWRHNTNVGGGCSGTAYKGVIYGFDQVLKWHKEQFHDGSQPCGDRNIQTFKTGLPRTDNNQWFGMKVIMWNYPDPSGATNAIFVHLELWLDIDNTNTWVKQGEKNDDGGWYAGMPDPNCPGAEHCGGHQDQIIKWGGPITEVRWDAGYTNVHFKWLSCREIQPNVLVPIPIPPPSEPPPPPPVSLLDVFGVRKLFATKVAGKEWFSTTWNNGTSRLLSNGNVDPFDTKLQYRNGSPSTTKLHILGNGEAEQDPIEVNTQCNLYINDSWLNTEVTVFMKVHATDDFDLSQIGLRSRSRHNSTGGCGFGNYISKFRDTGSTGVPPNETWSSTEIEVLHPLYKTDLATNISSTFTGFRTGDWVGFKSVTRTITASNSIKVEGYFCPNIANIAESIGWIKTSEFTFTAENLEPESTWATSPEVTACLGLGDGQADKIRNGDPTMFRYLSTGQHCWARTEGCKATRWKWLSVREIDPL